MNDILSALPEEWRNRAIVFLIGCVAGVGGIGWSGAFRDDPFYGKDGEELSIRIEALESFVFKNLEHRIDRIEHDDTAMKATQNACQSNFEMLYRQVNDFQNRFKVVPKGHGQ